MIKESRYLLIVFVALCGITWTACTQNRLPCLTAKTAILNVETMHKATDTSTVFTDSIFTLPEFDAYRDSGIFREIFSQNANFILSLSPVADSCTWTFSTDSFRTNTTYITFFYKRQLQFLSNACGYAYFYSLDSVHSKGGVVDSVLIINPSVTTNVSTKHLQIYIHPDY